MSRHRPYLIRGGALVVSALVIVLLLVPSDSWIPLDVRRSSLRTTQDGVGAWAASLERLEVPTAARFRSLTEEPPRGSTLVLLEPRVSPTPGELAILLGWVRGGGTLIYSPRSTDALLDSIGVALRDAGAGVEAASGSFAAHAWVGELEGREDESFWVLAPTDARVEPWVPLTTFGAPDEAWTSLAWAPEGRGGILLLAEADDVSNARLGTSPVAVAVTQAVLTLAEGDTVAFSEFHQGLDGRRGILRESLAIARSSGWGRVLLHGALVGSLLLMLAGRRFGAPIPEHSVSRRSPLEHVDALARIYRTARSHRLAAARLVRGAERRMGMTPSGPAVAGRDLLRRWAARPALADPAGAALAALDAEPIDLGGLCHALDDLVRAYRSQLSPTTRQ